MPINLPEEDSNLFAQVFCCPIGKFPFKYLGVPMHYGNLRREDIQPVIDKIIKGIAGWWHGVDDVNDRPVGNPKRRCDKHSSKFSLSYETKV
jgi:hypothetical protein